MLQSKSSGGPDAVLETHWFGLPWPAPFPLLPGNVLVIPGGSAWLPSRKRAAYLCWHTDSGAWTDSSHYLKSGFWILALQCNPISLLMGGICFGCTDKTSVWSCRVIVLRGSWLVFLGYLPSWLWRASFSCFGLLQEKPESGEAPFKDCSKGSENSMRRRVCGIREEAQVVQGPFQREGDSREVSSRPHSTEY